MAEHRVVLIENPARLSVNLGRLRIVADDCGPVHILPTDIDVLCLHHPVISITAGVLRVLSEAGSVLIATNSQHQPCGILHPIGTHRRQSLRLRQQIEFDVGDSAPRLWRRVVESRILSQAATLRHFGLKGALYLERLKTKVEPGDKGNHEGQAARHYWKHLLGGEYRREKQGAIDLVNSRLNFAYTVLRSMVIRQAVILGLNPVLGIGHRSSENPFNLADDFIEPYRFVVERQIKRLVETGDLAALDSGGKKELLDFVTDSVVMPEGTFRLAAAIECTLESFCRVLEGRPVELILPIHQRCR